MSPGAFLVLEDEPITVANLARILSRWRPVETAGSLREARELLLSPGRKWVGIVADIGLPDGSGFEIVTWVRERWPLLPVLMLTGHHDRKSINRAHSLRAEYVCKPPEEPDLQGFARRVVAFERVPEERLGLLVDELARRNGLTPREIEVLVAALARIPRKQLMEELKVTDNTLKSQVRSLLFKTHHESLETLTRSLLLDALGGSALAGMVGAPKYESDDEAE